MEMEMEMEYYRIFSIVLVKLEYAILTSFLIYVTAQQPLVGELAKYSHLRCGNINLMKERIARLYEQGADAVSIGQYVLRWFRWVKAGVVEILDPYNIIIITCHAPQVSEIIGPSDAADLFLLFSVKFNVTGFINAPPRSSVLRLFSTLDFKFNHSQFTIIDLVIAAFDKGQRVHRACYDKITCFDLVAA